MREVVLNEYTVGEKSENTLMFYFMIVLIVFGMFFNEIADIQFADEILEVLLVLIFAKALFFKQLGRPIGRDFKIFVTITLFYIGYSFAIHSNTSRSILTDILLQVKPYIGFFSVYYMGIRFNKTQKNKLKFVFLTLLIIAIGTLLWSMSHGKLSWNLMAIYTHPSKFYSALIIIGLGYLYCTSFSLKNILFFFFIISLGLLTQKGKMYGFFASAAFLTFMLKNGLELKFSLKNILLFSLLVFVVIWAAQDKVMFYFVETSTNDLDSLARPLLYYTSMNVLMDYFPFGPGFATFATHASRIDYSELYYNYDLNRIWGLSPEMSDFAADTFYPSLAQFGVIGVLLFIAFWVRIVKELNRNKKTSNSLKNYLIGVLIMVFLCIELVADAAYTNNRGFTLMVLLALILNDTNVDEDSTETYEH